jgi:hypothetical protein
MPELLTVRDAAVRLGVRPRDISDLFYSRRLDVDRCPVIGDRRLIPIDYLSGIQIELRRAGKLPQLRQWRVAELPRTPARNMGDAQ